MEIKAVLKKNRLVPRIEGETEEQYNARNEAERVRRETEKAEAERALRERAGQYRVLVTGPGESFQVFATNDDRALEFFKRRLPGILETQLAASAVVLPAGKVSSLSKAVRVVSVADGVVGYQPGDTFASASEMGRALQVANPGGLIAQSRRSGKKTFIIRGVTMCYAEDFNHETGEVI